MDLTTFLARGKITNKGALSYDELMHLCDGKFGITDAPCPLCGPACRRPHNRKLKKLRIWYDEPGFASFYCARCGESGYAHQHGAKPVAPQRLKQMCTETTQRENEHAKRQHEKALWLWQNRKPIEETPAANYLRECRRCSGPFPATLGFLAPLKTEHHPALIAAFGIPDEPEPGTLSITDDQVRGIHLTLLKPEGSDKIDSKPNKIMLGPSNGWPIVLAPINDTLALYICEGIETGLSLHEATGCGVWAAGAAGRLPGLADKVPGYAHCVTIAGETDRRGYAVELANRLISRGLHCELLFLDEEEEAA